MPKKGENIFKRKDGRYEARYVKKRDDNNNIIKYGYVYGKNYLEVKRKREFIISTLKEIENTKTNSKMNDNFNYSIREWLKNKSNLKESTYYNYASIIDGRLIPFFKSKKITTITHQDIIDFTSFLKKESLSNKRIKEILLLLQQYLKSKNINLNFKYPKQQKTKIVTLTNTEVNIIKKDALSSNEIKKIAIVLALFTGIRIGELCALTWKDIDLNKKMISITKNVIRAKVDNNEFKRKTIFKIDTPKSIYSIREIPINDEIIYLLKKFKNKYNENSYILTGNNRFISNDRFYYYYKCYLKKLNIKVHKFHVLRHTFATKSLACGIDIKTLSEILGHSSVKITLDIYIHITNDEKIKQINKLTYID